MVSGRPYYSISSSNWKGLSYASLWVSRARSSPGSNYTYFKLQSPLDSNRIHFRVDNIRGDFLNWETQRVRGFNNGVEVFIDFKDPVNGAFITSGNLINGASTTNSTTQSSMRAFFRSAVDSVVIQQTSSSDWIIAELMFQCNFILPLTLTNFSASEVNTFIRLHWEISKESTGLLFSAVERSENGREWLTINSINTHGNRNYTYDDLTPIAGVNYYRIKLVDADRRLTYSSILKVNKGGMRTFNLSVFPNPAKNHFVVSFNKAISKGMIFDPTGRIIHQMNTNTRAEQVDCSGWSPGTYFLVVETSNGSLTTRKIFLQ